MEAPRFLYSRLFSERFYCHPFSSGTLHRHDCSMGNTVHPELGPMVVIFKYGPKLRQTESAATAWLHPVAALCDGLPYARARAGKVFRFLTTIYHFS